MPSDKPDKVEKWRHPASAVTLLSQTAFVEKALENGLRVIEMGGYLYLAEETDEGHDMFRAYGPKWAYLYQARRVATQANAGGGKISVDVTVASGMTAELVTAWGYNSGTNTLGVYLLDEDNASVVKLGLVASSAGSNIGIPSIGTTATGTGNAVQSLKLLIGSGQKLSVYQDNAGLQNDTLTVSLVLLLPITAASDGSDVSWSVARSTNAGDVTLAASTISEANTMQAVLLP